MKKLFTFLLVVSAFAAFAQSYSSAIIGYWPFNGNANDDSGNNNHAIVNGASLTVDRFGNLNSAYNFNGNSFIEVTNSSFYNLSNAITFSAWAKFSSTKINSFISKWGNGNVGENNSYWLGTSYNNDTHRIIGQVTLTNATNLTTKTPDGYSDNYWHHYVTTYNGSIVTVYVDGLKVAESAAVSGDISSTTASLVFGAVSPTRRDMDLVGSLDEVMIFNKALTDQEANALYVTLGGNSIPPAIPPTPSITTSGIIGHWPLDGDAQDKSGNNSHGVIVGATLTSDRLGHDNSAYYFNGNSYIAVPNPTYFDLTEKLTLAFWVKFGQQNNFGAFISKWSGGRYDGKNAYFVGTSFIADPNDILASTFSNNGQLNLSPVSGYNDDQWHHLAIVYNNTKLTLYIDGQQKAESQIPPSPLNKTSSPLTFGTINPLIANQGFKGALDDIIIYNRSLSADEINNIYTGKIEVPPSQFCESIYCDNAGNVSVGTPLSATGYKLSVQGKIMAEGVKVELQSRWPDYVFDNAYTLKPLKEVGEYIRINNHLPEMPSASEVKNGGLDLAEMNIKLLQKIEELTLYQLELLEKVEKLERKITSITDKKN
jgi:hypothetical protein